MKIALVLAVIAVLALINAAVNNTESEEEPAWVESGARPTLIIDPGHGGMDNGAVSPSGLRESEVNLDIAQRLDLLMGFFGVRTVMTRDTEDVAYSANARSIRDKKNEDMRNRVKLINSFENAVLISIHQNKYTDSGPFGAQVLYARTQGSKELAENMQKLMINALNPRNYRAAARIPGRVFIMNNVKIPAILIECGFLSNPEEEALLKTGEYRLKIAMTIAAGYLSSRNYT